MLLLCLDSSAVASAALVTGAGEIAGSFVSPDTRSHAEVLAPAVRDLLDGHEDGTEDEDAEPRRITLTGIGPRWAGGPPPLDPPGEAPARGH